MKIFTTSAWRLLASIGVVGCAAAFAINVVQVEDAVERSASPVERTGLVANLYTSGQFVGLLLLLVLGVLMVTDEFAQQTATATFLAMPRRAWVIAAKFVTALGIGVGAWLTTTIAAAVPALIFLRLHRLSGGLDDGLVQRAIVLNLLVYARWPVLGVGLGTLLPRQVVAVGLSAGMYLVGTQALVGFAALSAAILHSPWIRQGVVLAPAYASRLLVEGAPTPAAPARWIAAMVLTGYALLATAVGAAILYRRDIT